LIYGEATGRLVFGRSEFLVIQFEKEVMAKDKTRIWSKNRSLNRQSQRRENFPVGLHEDIEVVYGDNRRGGHSASMVAAPSSPSPHCKNRKEVMRQR
jgi:hypothetical protein